jgi:hypothetical protein
MRKSPVNVFRHTLSQDLYYEGTLVLSYSVNYPVFQSAENKDALAKINAFYLSRANEYVRYIQKVLYQDAVSDYKDRGKEDFPFNQYEALEDFTVTYNRNCLISLYFDRYQYTGGAHGLTTRTSDTWDIRSARRISLGFLFPKGEDYSVMLQEIIIQQIQKQISDGEDIYFEDYEKLVHETFNEESFYLTPDALVIYFQQYDIAPYASGIREFAIPYEEIPIRLPGCRNFKAY